MNKIKNLFLFFVIITFLLFYFLYTFFLKFHIDFAIKSFFKRYNCQIRKCNLGLSKSIWQCISRFKNSSLTSKSIGKIHIRRFFKIRICYLESKNICCRQLYNLIKWTSRKSKNSWQKLLHRNQNRRKMELW